MAILTVRHSSFVHDLVLFVFTVITIAGDELGICEATAVVQHKVPAIYVFGDSTADVGNNNYLFETGNTISKANFPHNGIDFPYSRATGRFSNGYNGIDFLAAQMGYRRSPPAFLSLSKKNNHQTVRGLTGANFASAGSGILDSTGTAISMSRQIQYFYRLQSNIIVHINTENANMLLSKSIFLISSGGNDLFDYFSRNKNSSTTDAEQFIANLVTRYEDHLKALYNLGARKFGIVDVPPIGCCPYPRSQNPAGACVYILNEVALKFNNALKQMAENLSLGLKGMKYSIGSSYQVMSSIIGNPGALGFKEVKSACCGAGKFNGESPCTPNATLCSERNHYVFWDLLHPTHTTSKLAALAIYNGSSQFASPINFRQLVEDEH